MKKAIALFTALMLCAAMLMGCGKEADIAGKTTPLNEQAEPAAPKSEPTAEPEPAATTESELEEHKLSLGRMEGGVYENSYAGFGCTLDSDWTFYSAEELQELPETIKEGFEGTELGEAMENYPQITDMMAVNEETLMSMNVLYTKIRVQERLAYKLLSEEEVIESTLEEQQDSLIEAYAQIGVTVKAMEMVDVSFLGESHKALYTEGELSGVPMYVLQVIDNTRGEYGITLAASSCLEDRTQEILDLFYKVE